MTHQPSLSRFWIAPAMLKAPSTSTAAAKNVASTSSAMPGLMKASTPKITDAMPPTRNTHQVRLHSACASEPSRDRIAELAIICSLARGRALSLLFGSPPILRL